MPSVSLASELRLPRLMTVRQTAQYVGLSMQTLYNMKSASYRGQRIPGRLVINNRVRYDRNVLDEWIEDSLLKAAS